MTETYVQMFLALAGVIGVILVVSLFLKKRQAVTGLMNIVAYQSLGQRKAIAAMKIGREILLLGITHNDIKLLKTFNENDIEMDSVLDISNKIKKLKGFKERLNESE